MTFSLSRRWLSATALTLTLAMGMTGCSTFDLVNALTTTGSYTRTADLAYGKDARQQLDVYVPTKPRAQHPVVVFFYGGSWEGGDRANYAFAAQALTAKGFYVVLPDYRVYPQVRFPAFVEDGAAAVAWTLDHIDQYGGNPEHVFLMGHSAGAQIAALLALDETYLQAQTVSTQALDGWVGLSGPYDFLPLTSATLKDIFGPPERYPASQPINFVTGNEPPAFLLHGTGDRTVYPKNTRNLAARLEQAGVSVQTHYFEGMGHVRIVASLAQPFRFAGSTLSLVTDWLGEQLETTNGQ